MAQAQPAEQRLAAYVEKRLLGRLGLPGRPFTLEPAHAGIHSQVFFLSIENARPLVLKVVPKRERFRSIAACSRHLSESGIAAPEIIVADEDSRFFSRRGMHVLCEERIAGETLQHAGRTPELIAQVAGFFATLHARTRDAWGGIEKGKKGGLFLYLYKKCASRVRDWGAVDPAATAGLKSRILSLLASWEPAVNGLAGFSLSHGDPNPNNIIMRDSDKKLFLLDAGTMRYLPRGIDYFMLQAYFCFNSRQNADLFEEVYCRSLSGRELREFGDTREFFRLYVVILFLHDLATRFAALEKSSPYYDEFASLIPRAKNALAEIIE